ncbi:HNH endonuclease signature motif containing protein [Paraburkholderia sediminicola]|uniref:HNH endonuclease n=1 Tax=Paraburkholderia sediminicola TaxID=458836 RepID=UPI0038B7024F
MATPHRPQYFAINTDRDSYRKTHPQDTKGDPFRFWLQHGFGFMTPTPDNRMQVEGRLSEIKPGDMLFAYESGNRRGFIAAGVALERWDRISYRGKHPELFCDPAETYFQIKVDWNADFSCSLDEMQAKGVGSPGATIVPIRDEKNVDFLFHKLANLNGQPKLERLRTGEKADSSSAVLIDPRWDARELMNAAVTAAVALNDERSDEPLQIVWNEQALPATAVFSLPPGAAPGENELRAAALAGATFRSFPDPVDLELDSLAQRNDLNTETRREITARIGQGRFRAALLQLHGRCAVTGVSTPAVLRAAHIHRWADCADTPAARLDLENGLLLTANLDALFEAGLITFDDEGLIAISSRLDADARKSLGIHAQMRLYRSPSSTQRIYLQKHRARTHAARESDDRDSCATGADSPHIKLTSCVGSPVV